MVIVHVESCSRIDVSPIVSMIQFCFNVLNERFITVRFVFSAFFWCARVYVRINMNIILSSKPTYWVNFRWFGPGDIGSPRDMKHWNIFDPTSKWWNESDFLPKTQNLWESRSSRCACHTFKIRVNYDWIDWSILWSLVTYTCVLDMYFFMSYLY